MSGAVSDMAFLTIDAINALTHDDFAATFGEIAEHSPWVAEGAATRRPFPNREAMIAAFEAAMRAADEAHQLALIRAHPDLAGRAAIAGELTADSKAEQKGAGLDTLTAAEFERFTSLNTRYKAKYHFPFIFAVKGATKDMILAAFEARLKNSEKAEFEMALTQIARIFRFRLEARVAE
jgi:2-oxo-4-hydroxy-4-carboxy-5-ureidoimidazoline decarboxylase